MKISENLAVLVFVGIVVEVIDIVVPEGRR